MSLHPKMCLFAKLQQLQWLHHGSTEADFYSPLSSIPFFLTALVTICDMCIMASVRDLVQASTVLTLFFAWNFSRMFKELEAKQNVMIHRVKATHSL